MNQPVAPTTKNTITKKWDTKYVDVFFRDEHRGTWTLYENDRLGANEMILSIDMAARPEAPNLQRPLSERIIIHRVNVLYYSVIEADAEVEVDPNYRPPSGLVTP